MNFEKLFIQIDELIDLMYKNEVVMAFQKLSEYIPDITNCINSFILNITKYNSMGANISENIVIRQINNLLDGIENKDVLLIADTLKYEIKPSLKIYQQILSQE